MDNYLRDSTDCSKCHVFIYTYSGKPIFSTVTSRDLVTLIGTLCAIGSKFENLFENCPQPDSLRYIMWSDLTIAYLDKGPIQCVAVSKTDPPVALRRILELLHRQLVSILTRSIDKTLSKRPSYDPSHLMGGTSNILVQSVTRSHSSLLGMIEGFHTLTMDPAYRKIVEAFVQVIQTPSILASFMLADDMIVSIALGKDVVISANDVVIVSNMVVASKSLKKMESWVPICLPSIDENAFVHLYVNSVADDVWMVYISALGDSKSFYSLSDHHLNTKELINKSGCINKIMSALRSPPLSLEHFGITHAVMWLRDIGQYTIAGRNLTDALPQFKAIWHKLMFQTKPTQLILKMADSTYCFSKDNSTCLWLEVSSDREVDENFIKRISNYFTEHKDWFFISKFPEIMQ